MRVGIDGDDAKRVKFSLPNSASDEEVINDEEYEDAKATWDDDEVKDLGGLEQGEQYPPLETNEPHKKRTNEECQIVSFKNDWASNEREPREWIKEIQNEINYLRMKGIDIDEVFLVLVKIMKKVKIGFGLIGMNLNCRERLKIYFISGLEGEIVVGPYHISVKPIYGLVLF